MEPAQEPDDTPAVPIAKTVSEQLHRMLHAKRQQGELIEHNLEKGLGNEESLRQLLGAFLPKRFGVTKGKIVNSAGNKSRHLDLIIYDALNCPSLFLDEHANQLLPVEGVYSAVDIKTTLTSTALADAFENLNSVYALSERQDTSTNDFVTCCPPNLAVFSFGADRSLEAIAKQFDSLSNAHPATESFSDYSTKSPGHEDHTGRYFMVHELFVMGQGAVVQMLSGNIEVYRWVEYTLGMFLTGIVNSFQRMQLPELPLLRYLNWIEVDQWVGGDKVAQRLARRK
jgi:hypothetical protein